MIHPTPNDVGRHVLYQSTVRERRQRGVITSMNEFFVFVRYGADSASQATRRQDLEWE